MWRWFVVALAGLSACAQRQHLPAADLCPKPPSSTALVSIDRGRDSSQRLLLRTQSDSRAVVYVALDTLGAPLFSARWQNAPLQLERRDLYRGPQPAELLAAVYWWQVRRRITPECAASAGLKLRPVDGGVDLYRGQRPWWQWRAERDDEFSLPDYRVRIDRREVRP